MGRECEECASGVLLRGLGKHGMLEVVGVGVNMQQCHELVRGCSGMCCVGQTWNFGG